MQTKCIDEGVTQEVIGEGLIRPCVDCGRRTGSFCDTGDVVAGVCRLALGRLAATPLCTVCDAKHGKCHLCRRMPWATQPPWW